MWFKTPLIVFLAQFICTFSLEQDSSVTIKLYHSLEAPPAEPQFKERSTIKVHSLRSGQAIVEQKGLDDADRKKLHSLAVMNEFYPIMAVVFAADGSRQTFYSSVKACMLVESQLDERLSISLDYTGRVIGVTLVVASKATCEGTNASLEDITDFTTSVYIRHTETGAIPDTASFIQKMEREREARERNEGKDNRSFIAKYWMYIVPVVIVVLISSATSPEGGNQ